MSTTKSTVLPPGLPLEAPAALPSGHLDIEVTPHHIDSLGHVNNAVYVEYFERGRIAFYEQLALVLESAHAPRLGTVVVNLNVNFRDECVAGDRLHLVTRGHSRGNRSFVLEQHLARPHGTPVADCHVTSVIMNLDSRALEALPDTLVAALPPRGPDQ